MFGLEDQKKKKPREEFVFDLEKELKDPDRQKELKAKLEARVQQVKELLRAGEDKPDFHRLSLLLNGYLAALKVVGRCMAAKPGGRG